MFEHIIQLYNASSERFIGMYGVFQPILLVRDPELVHNILAKDFDHFTDRGDKWKSLRVKLSPTFTSGKLKSMFPTFVDCGHGLQNHLDDASRTSETINIRDVSAIYTINVLASVAFGIQIDTFKDPDNDFRRYGRHMFALNLKNGLRFGLNFLAPRVMALLGLHMVDADVERFIYGMVTSNLRYREDNNFARKDFFQLLIRLHRTGSAPDDPF